MQRNPKPRSLLFTLLLACIAILMANMLFVSYPVYTQNYLLADIIAWQVHTALVDGPAGDL